MTDATIRSTKTALRSVALHVLAGAAIIALSVTPAHACSCREFEDWGFLAPRDGRLPVNAAGVAWYAPWLHYFAEAPGIETLERRFTAEIREDGVFSQLPVSVVPVEGFPGVYVVGADGGLKAGATYRFTVDRTHLSGIHPGQVVVTVDHEGLSSDTEFGLQIGPATSNQVRVAGGAACFTSILATKVTIDSNLAPHASRWREQMLYRTIVDGDVEWVAPPDLCAHIPPGRSREETGGTFTS